jgi:uncharacterized protein (DUF4415 family)
LSSDFYKKYRLQFYGVTFGKISGNYVTIPLRFVSKLTRNVSRTTLQSFKQHNFRVYKPMNMKEKATDTEQRQADKVEIAVRLDAELLEQIQHLTNDPSKVIEVAIRQWLRGEVPRDDELTRTPHRMPVPPRGEWND